MFAFYENRNKEFVFFQSNKLEISAHLHSHLELVYMLEGKTDTIVDGVKDTLYAGDVFITFPNQIHQYRNIGPGKYFLLIFSPDFLPDIKDIFINNIPESAIIKNAFSNARLLVLLQAVLEAYKGSSPYKEITIKGYLLAFMSELLPLMKLLPVKNTGLSVLRNILDYCSENYIKDLSLEVVSKDLHISKYYISHIFNEKLFMGFNEYINGLRISDACRYLSKDKYNITEIALMVGFNTPRTFNRAFFKQLGITPRDYKTRKYAVLNSEAP